MLFKVFNLILLMNLCLEDCHSASAIEKCGNSQTETVKPFLEKKNDTIEDGVLKNDVLIKKPYSNLLVNTAGLGFMHKLPSINTSTNNPSVRDTSKVENAFYQSCRMWTAGIKSFEDSGTTFVKFHLSKITSFEVSNPNTTFVEFQRSNITSFEVSNPNTTSVELQQSNITSVEDSNPNITSVELQQSNITSVEDSNITSVEFQRSNITAI